MTRTAILGLMMLATSGCAPLRVAMDDVWLDARDAASRLWRGDGPTLAASPAEVPPGADGDSVAWRSALEMDALRVVISLRQKQLWLMGGDTAVLLSAPVAIGREVVFTYGERSWNFRTPTGRREVLEKEESPLWVPPDWHYLEIAVQRGLEPVQLRVGQKVALSDGTRIEVRKDARVGRVNRWGHWWPFTPGSELIFDGKIFIPPLASPQRRIPRILGTHSLALGDGYLIHGTPEEHSIGQEASHGCVRMFNHDVARLFELVPPGTPVFIY